MKRKFAVYTSMLLFVTAAVLTVAMMSAEAKRGDGPIIYVANQGLYYDSIVTADPLPPKGPFQVLNTDGIAQGFGTPLWTQFGPGDPGYKGGRWVVGGNHYFSCPLLGPGREAP